MTRRYLSLQLTNLPIDRLRAKLRQKGETLPEPFALYTNGARGETLHAVDAAAAALGITAGQKLADARAILPNLALAPATPEADRRFLEGLAAAAWRYTPSVALDRRDADDDASGDPPGDHALLLDITGAAHLFGGEAALLAEIGQRLDKLGLGHRLAIADHQAKAWAWARYGAGGVLTGTAAETALAELPVQALRLEATTTMALIRLGIRTIGELQALPQRSLIQRFGRELVLALDRLCGHASQLFTPLREPPCFAARLSWPEPIGRTEDIAAGILDLLTRLTIELERAVAGARRLELWLFRVDGEAVRLAVKTGRPSRHATHLLKLFELQLDGLDVGFGIESLRLEVADMAPLRPEQVDLAQDQDAAELARLTDQLRLRLGADAVQRLCPVASHWPERAVEAVDPATAPETDEVWLARLPRPLHLMTEPVQVEAMAQVPDGPPLKLRRFGRSEPVRTARGPERIEPEWWHSDGPLPRPRDYYRLIDARGQDLWLYRDGRYGDPTSPAWYVHGAFD